MVVTREPGGTATGEKIRRLLLDTATAGLSPMAELALMFASRAQHITEVIQPALAEGRIVLCDRFTDSTEAYQGGGRKLGSEPVLALHRILCHGLQPDLTILMDSDVAASVERARRRNKADSREKWPRQTRREPLRTGESRFFHQSAQRVPGNRCSRAAQSRPGRCARNGGGNPRADRGDCQAKDEVGSEDGVKQLSAVSSQLSVKALGTVHLARSWESRTLFSVILLDSTNLPALNANC